MKDERYLEFQKKLRDRALSLIQKHGYERLDSSIDAVADWEGFQEILAQIDTTIWFNERKVLKEIEPKTPHRPGNADILISLSNQDMFCEVTSPESSQNQLLKQDENSVKLRNLLKKQPWMSESDAEHEIRNTKIIRTLLDKTNRQLPEDYPGILIMDTGKSMISSFSVKETAKKLFPSRNQIILIMLWSLERGSMIETPPFVFLNSKSQFQKTGINLLNYLGIIPTEII